MGASLPSADDSIELILEIDELEENFQLINQRYSQLKEDLIKKFKTVNGIALTGSGQSILNQVDNSKIMQQPAVQDFVQSLVTFAEFAQLANVCNENRSKYQNEINDCLNQVERISSSFRRVFLSSAQKEKGRMAYQRLIEISNGEYGSSIDTARKCLNEKVDRNKALKVLLEKSNDYIDVLNALGPGLSIPAEHPAGTLIKLFTDQEDMAKRATLLVAENQRKLRLEIEQQAELIAAQNAFQQLQKIDIEQLNKVKSGLRTKTLRDAGYDSMLPANGLCS